MYQVDRSSKGSVPGRVSLVDEESIEQSHDIYLRFTGARGASFSLRLYKQTFVPRDDEPQFARLYYAQILPTPHEKVHRATASIYNDTNSKPNPISRLQQ